MKAILVMDMPENCEECPLRNEWSAICEIDTDTCPLIEMPYRMPESLQDSDTKVGGYVCGWNGCLDVIGGGENG